MSLQKYWKKRDFEKTPEPRGHSAKSGSQLEYFIQRHAARRLHYDFRLELAGKLLSWAVPKGPSLDPADKRLAVHVEDHPLSYGSFEGVIPPKQYGAGTVLLWDRGVWKPIGDPAKAYRQGRLKFQLEGKKLSGAWNLVRMGPPQQAKENWLLIKEKDEAARRGADADITALRPESVARDANVKAKPAPKKARRKAGLPETMKPQLATLSEHAPEGDEWLSEVKFDGYRVLCRIDDGKVRLFTRNGNDWTNKWKSIADAAAKLPVKQAWLDGELVAIDETGAIRFQALQNLMRHNHSAQLVYYVFDLIFLDGEDYRARPLLERKTALQKILAAQKPNASILYNDHIVGGAKDVFEHACLHSLEGIIAKRADAPYSQIRTKDWLKLKCRHRQEFVIGGFTEAKGTRNGFGALLVGVYEDGKLRYAGRVGSGFDEAKLKSLAALFSRLEQSQPPFVNPPTGSERRGVHWLRPELVAEVNFAEWTEDSIIRQASFEALREDKPGREIVRERPIEELEAPARKKSQAAQAKIIPSSTATPQIAGVTLTHASRVLFPGVGWTKLDLARYYEDVADWILPHLENRPLTLVRCPQGGMGKCFFQKHVNETTSAELESVEVPEEDGTALYMLANNLPALVRLVQMGVLELHTWGARSEHLQRPDRFIFDLDPAPDLAWTQVVEAAQLIRALLEDLGLRSFLKTTGGKGLHIVVPLKPERPWTEVKAFTRAIAEHLATHLPERFTAKISKAKRHDKIFIDYLRNGMGATAVAAYSTRARASAPISTPIAWEDLNDDLHSDQFNVGNIRQRLDQLKVDPWKEYFRLKQRLSAAMLKKYST